MGIVKDHNITKILRNRSLRNDPEVIELICGILEGQDDDIDKVGELVLNPNTDRKLEELAEALQRIEDEESEDLEDEDEDEFNDEEDDSDIDEDDDIADIDPLEEEE